MKKWLVRILTGFILLVAFVLLAGFVFFRLANRTNGQITTSAGEQRSYYLYVPESYDPAVPTALILSMHGYADWPAHHMDTTRWNDLADEYGLIVVYPSGTRFPMRWRASNLSNEPSTSTEDIVFLSELIDTLQAGYNIDPRRIYANGLSNGAGMSFVLSCNLSERIAAIGLVAGAYLYPWESCNPARPVPAIVFHGTADPIVPFEGGPSRSFDLDFPYIPDWVDVLADRNGCSGEPRALPARGQVSGVEYTGCAADVVFYTINEGGHTWPGGVPLPEGITGVTSTEIDATREMWDFYQQHPLP